MLIMPSKKKTCQSPAAGRLRIGDDWHAMIELYLYTEENLL